MKRLATLALPLFLLVTVLLSGCGSSSSLRLLESHEWIVNKVNYAPAGGSSAITLKFSGGKVSGSTGINQLNGTYTAGSDKSMSIQAAVSTKATGTAEDTSAEQNLLQALGSVTSFAADDGALSLFDSNGMAIVTCKAEVPTPLVGSNWKLSQYSDGKGGLVAALGSTTVSVQFAANGTFSGSSGMDVYHGKYGVTGSTIQIVAPQATQISGPGDLTNQENAYLALLPKAASFSVSGGQLTLLDSSGQVVVVFTAQ